MSVTYTTVAINARLQAIATMLDGGQFVLLAGSTVICIITLPTPSGTVSGGVFNINVPPNGTAIATGTVTSVSLRDSTAASIVTDLSVGIPLSGADVILFNGLNSTLVSATQAVQILGGQITGS